MFVLPFVLAFGVFWEIVEFTIHLITTAMGTEVSGATQHGLEDTMFDLVFDIVGGVVVATWGHVHLNGVVGHVQQLLDGRVPD